MAAKLDWHGRELKLAGAFTVATVKQVDGGTWWQVIGSTGLGDLLRERWEVEEDAKQDIRRDVKRILEAQGVKIEG